MISSAPTHSTSSTGTLPSQPGGGSSNVLASAIAQIGKGYGWGAKIDSTLQTLKYDCSSLVASVYANAGFSLPRTSQAQAAATTPTNNPQPGDLVFGGGSGSPGVGDGTPNSHVGIYAGNGQVVSALSEALGIKSTPVWAGATYGHVAGYSNSAGAAAASTISPSAAAPAVQSADATAFWKWALAYLLFWFIVTAMTGYGGAWADAGSGFALLVLTTVLLTQGGKAMTNAVAIFNAA